MSRYKLLEGIGEGEFGQVRKGYDTYLRRNVAIKFLKSKNDPVRFHMFKREINELYKELENPHIVDIYDSNLNAPTPYFVMEHCDGGNLERLIGKVDAKQLIVILKSLVIALKPMHSLGGFQRDLKPQNIALVKKNNAYVCKLLDFGLARTPDNSTAMTHTVGGTFPYIDPEVLGGERQFSSASDIYSLGITAFELLNGRPEITARFITPGPSKLIDLLHWMTASKSQDRPNLHQINTSICELEKELNSQGIQGFWASLSYPGLIAGTAGAALILAGLFGDE